MDSRWISAVMVVAGAGWIGYFYHYRPRKHDHGDRDRIPSWPAYGIIDWYLKVSTLAVLLAAIFSDHPALARLYDSPLLFYIGLAVAGLALGLFGSAMRHLDAQYTPAHDSHLPSDVVTTGPYRYIRHPVYTANLLLMSGLFVATGSLWLVLNLAILVVYYLVTVRREETAIRERFPEYQDYRQRTGRFLPRTLTGFRRPQSRI